MQKGEIVLFLKSGLKTQKKKSKATGTALEDIETGKFSNDKLVYPSDIEEEEEGATDKRLNLSGTDNRPEIFSGKI